ncbi:Protein of unknown function [Desulfocicer vacuolatum DSM 3385]|uniref:DUF3450 domain-containing protein n=1 Tax=Desulfocicer vacuolatum DSM 3385 TaxID=1121400 RepID=A0A1W1YSA5_9BACT|nr:DUF3450 domain-containing protein [Desulfocicer vacuolatum]SMC39090.1 Protein of unknown function [Desulfocicer vacuolatum DSM 3385]
MKYSADLWKYFKLFCGQSRIRIRSRSGYKNNRWHPLSFYALLPPGLILGLLLIFQPVPVLGNAHTASQVKKVAEKTVITDTATQKAVESWVDEEQKLMDRIEAVSTRLKHTRWQVEKNKIFQQTLAAKIETLKAQGAELEKVETQLLPVLESTLQKLGYFVNRDLPMELERRLQAIDSSQSVLDDYDMSLLIKTRAVLDSLIREVDMGYSVGVREDKIEVDGRARQVKLLRVGRIGLFALTPDGQTAYVWDRDQNRYIALEGGETDITQAMEIAEGIRIIGLSRLPVTLTESAGSAQAEPGKGGDSIENN